MYRRLLPVLAFLLAVVAPCRAKAADIPVVDEHKVEVHGFVSPGFVVTTGNNYLAKSKRGSFEFSEVGLNFTVQLTEKLRTGVQIFAHDLGPIGNYSPKADWYYLDYRFEDWLGFRGGRVKIPFGLYNDTADIDAARVPVLLPQSVYPATSRDWLLAQTGGEIYGRVRMGILGAFEYRLFFGTIFIDAATQSTVTTPVTDVDVPFVVGERLMWETPIEGLRAGGSLEATRIDLSLIVPPNTPNIPAGPLTFGIPATLAIGSVEYSKDRLLLAAEYSRWTSRLDSSVPLPGVANKVVGERGYVMASYRLADWFTPGAYYSMYFPQVDNRSGRDKSMHDIAGTLRFDVNSWWIIKLEGHFMSGTAGLDPALNNNIPATKLEQNWGAFFLKTTAHF